MGKSDKRNEHGTLTVNCCQTVAVYDFSFWKKEFKHKYIEHSIHDLSKVLWQNL